MPVIFWIAFLCLGECPHLKVLSPQFRTQNPNPQPPLQLECIQMTSVLSVTPATADFDWDEACCRLLVSKFLWLSVAGWVPPCSELESLCLILHSGPCYSHDLLPVCSKTSLNRYSWNHFGLNLNFLNPCLPSFMNFIILVGHIFQ